MAKAAALFGVDPLSLLNLPTAKPAHWYPRA
jgi:hypothetical protein